jgi:hypothetical protein
MPLLQQNAPPHGTVALHAFVHAPFAHVGFIPPHGVHAMPFFPHALFAAPEVHDAPSQQPPWHASPPAHDVPQRCVVVSHAWPVGQSRFESLHPHDVEPMHAVPFDDDAQSEFRPHPHVVPAHAAPSGDVEQSTHAPGAPQLAAVPTHAPASIGGGGASGGASVCTGESIGESTGASIIAASTGGGAVRSIAAASNDCAASNGGA